MTKIHANISPLAYVSDQSEIGENTVVEAGAWIGPGAIIGNNCRIEHGASVGYQYDKSETKPAVIEDGCLIATGAIIYHTTHLHKNVIIRHHAVIREHVEIGESTSIGINATIQHHVKIGKYCSLHNFVDIADYSTLGEYIFIGPGFLSFADNNLDYKRPRLHKPYKGIIIKDKARIGGNVTMMSESIVGEETFVGAGSTVHGKLEDRMICLGDPARAIKKLPKDQELQK